MKHIITLHHPLATLRGALRARAGRDARSAWAAAATAASAAVKRHFPPGGTAPTQPASVPVHPQPADRVQGLSLTAAPAEAAAAAARWERRGTRAIPWVEGGVLVLLFAYFGGGLAAILGGL